MDKVKKWFFEDDDGEEYEDFNETSTTVEEPDEPKTSLFEKPKSDRTSKMVNKLNDSNLVLFEPRSYSETQDIALYLKQKKAAVVNLHRLQKEQSKRVIDFLSGVIYAIDGDIQQIGPKIFLCTPKNVLVSGNISLDEEEISN